VQIVYFSVLAGVCGTGLGGLLAVLLGKRSPLLTCWVLSFAAGVMVSIVGFGLLPEAIELTDVWRAILGLIIGIVVIMNLNRLVDALTEKRAQQARHGKVHETHEELYHEKMLLTQKKNMLRSGLIMLAAIGVHNIPEGLAIGAGGQHNIEMGTLLALMIALHNVPEGMAIAAPLVAGGMGRGKTILLTALSGAPTVLGCLLGLWVGNISQIAIALSLSAAGGAMLYVVFGEIIPQSVVMTKDRTATVVTLFGIIAGLLISSV